MMSHSKASRGLLGPVMGIACLFMGDGATLTPGSTLVTQAEARDAHQLTPRNHRRVARHAKHRAVVGAAIPFDFGNSAGSSPYYGYTPGAYGGTGCYRGPYGLTCAP